MPGYQNTFTLITERVAPVTNEPIRPMTSKQVKKAHKAANKAPKLSRAEQRKLELAEQERIRKELDKDRQANRARLAREKKKAKEDKEKEERRKKGRPLVDVRPSQDTIARFVRGNGLGKKRDGAGQEISKMAPLAEEGTERADNADAVIEIEENAIPAPAPELEARNEACRGADQEVAAVSELDPRVQESSKDDVQSEGEFEADNAPGPHPQNDPDSLRPNEGKELSLGGLQSQSANGKEPERSVQSVQTTLEDAAPGSSTSHVKITHSSSNLPLLPSSKKREQLLEVEAQEKPILPAAVSASQAFWDDELDDDLMQELEAVGRQRVDQRDSVTEPDQQCHGLSLHEATSRPMKTLQSAGVHEPPSNKNKDLEDDVLAGIGTQAMGLWEEEDEESLLADQTRESLPCFETSTSLRPCPDTAHATENNADTLEDLEALLESTPHPEPIHQPSAPRLDGSEPNTSRHHRPPPVRKLKGSSSFTEDDLDDELLQQLDIEIQVNGNTTVRPTDAERSTSETNPRSPAVTCPPTIHETRIDDGLDKLMPPPPPNSQQPPMSTQAVLSNFDDYFPSPSQQERELEDDFDCFPKSQPTPCPPPKRFRPQEQQKPSEPPALEKPQSQKRFFSASGSNELLSLAIHRSRRDAAMDELQRKDRQRFEAGKLQAKQTAQQGRQFMPPRQNALRNMNNQSGRQPRPAGKPPAWTTNENIEPPSKRQKMTRTNGQVRPPPFRQPGANTPRPSPKPPVFKPTIKPPPGKENRQQEVRPMASQGSDYGGDWIDEMALDMASTGRGCLSATQMAVDRGDGRWVR